MQGITVVIASGDSGSAGCDGPPEIVAQYGLGVSGLASTPFNVAVGGTDFDDVSSWSLYWNPTNAPLSQSSAKSYIPEVTWNDSCAQSGLTGCTNPSSFQGFDEGVDLVAGGGGPSSCTNPTGSLPSISCTGGYSKPSWQSGTAVPQDGARDIPDISLFAGNGMNSTYYVVCQMDANMGGNSCDLNSPYYDFQGAGGTSTSAQTFAGIMALVNQAHGRQGNANYFLYPLAAETGASCNSSTAPPTSSTCIFYDVTKGNNSVACQFGAPDCTNTPASGYGIMVVNPASTPQTPAWTTNRGYDLATGLGSVNVANLVNNWTSVSFTPSTTTLSLSTNPATNPITLPHGQSVNVTINAAPASGNGTPTGDVSLIAQTSNSQNVSSTTGIGSFTLSAGSVSSTTNMLPGGSYNVIAHYAGNGTYGASDSNAVPVAVGKESSQTATSLVTFNASGNPTYGATTTPYGSSYVLRVDVTNSSGQKCAAATGAIFYPCPAGNVTVTPPPVDQGAPSSSVPGIYLLNSQGYAEDWFAQLVPQTWNFTATYPGDNSYNLSSSTNAITITPAPTTCTVNAPALVVEQTAVTLTANLATQSNGVAPTGTVQFLNGSTPLGTVPVSGTAYSASTGAYASGQVVLNVPLPLGASSITAQYNGDSNYAGSTSPAVTVTVSDFSIGANPITINISAPGQSGTSTISIAPLGGFTGTVNLNAGSGCPTGATCTVSPSPINVVGPAAVTATLTVSTTGGSSASSRPSPPRVPPRVRLPLAWRWLFALLLALGALASLARALRRPAAVLTGAALLVVGAWAACGGGGGGGGVVNGQPIANFSTTSLSFGPQTVGSTSAAQTVTLSNIGNASLYLMTIGVNGDESGDFAEANACPSYVASGASCTISVEFTPTAPGSCNAWILIDDTAASSPQSVNLTGTGVLPPTPPGTYYPIVTASSGADSHSVTLTVIVQ